MSQVTSETVSSTISFNISGSNGNGFITLQPQVARPIKPLAGLNLYSDGNNNISWRSMTGNNFTINTAASTESRTWILPDSNGELATVDSINTKEDKSKKGKPNGYASLGDDGLVPIEQLPAAVSGFAPNIVCVLYATCAVLPESSVSDINFVTTPPTVFASLPGFEPNTQSKLSVDTINGDFIMDTPGTIYEFKIDTYWRQNANTGERRLISFLPQNGDLQSDQVTHREELGLLASTHGQIISCNSFVHVYNLGASGGFSAGLEISAPNATTDRIVDVRIRVIRWQ